MFKPIHIIGIAVFFILSLFSLGFCEESMTITTYYPSPYGSYRQLSVTSPNGANLTGFLVDIRNDDVTGGESHGLRIRAGNNSSDLPLQILDRTETTEFLRVRGDGNVGIGTNNPSTFKLQVLGNVGPNTDNSYDLGSVGVKWRDVYCTRNAFNGSDRRQKTNIIDTLLGLNFIMNLRPVQYNWIKEDDGKHQGIIAQELEKVITDKGIEFAGLRYDKKTDSYALSYTEFIGPLIKAVQQQQKQIESLKSEINDLKSRLNQSK